MSAYEAQGSGVIDHALLQNLYEMGPNHGFIRINGAAAGGVVSSAGTDLETDYTGFEAMVNGTHVVVTAGSVTHSAGHATLPRMDMVIVNSSGTVAIVEGTPTAEAATQTKPPAGTLTANNLMHSLVYVPALASVILDANIFDRRIEIAETRAEGPAVLLPVSGTTGAASTQQLNSNTTATVGAVILPALMAPTSLTFNVTAVGTAGTLDVALFSHDGQTRHISFTTASISGSGLVRTTFTAVRLPAGIYYLVMNPNSTADVTVSTWTSASPVIIAAAASGENELSGTITITASTMPSTFDPDTGVTYAANDVISAKLN
ncbi:MAG: hypothetical protein NUW01_18175 [Gemmatimonadaceae bacterium]|nr:hypothetical protein [Gemmatimonadaceae bacterium]